MGNCNDRPNKSNEIKKCARCNQQFGCGASGKCWCFEVSISPEALKYIEDQYNGCLCPECLQLVSNLSDSEIC
ncbi:MAG: cysteine-rich CWC family protein [Bacteroidetes bacterium]|nr:cysteine-rich CWC family protein [Bacteroidota bacterium]